MSDTAHLGVSVDVNSVRSATVALGQLVTSASAAERGIAQSASGVQNSLQNLSSSITNVEQRLGALGATSNNAHVRIGRSATTASNEVVQANTKAARSYDAVGNTAASMAKRVIAAYASFATLKSIYETSTQLDMMDKSFGAITGSSAAAAGEMAYVRAEAERLGQNFLTLATTYRGFAAAAKGAGMELSEAKHIFSSVTESATVLGLSSYKTGLALYALEQMISKGTVTMEELRRQLGDQIPGAFSIAAKAMGVNEKALADMIKKGDLATKDFLPKFAQALSDAFKVNDAILKTPVREMERLKNAFIEAQETIANSGFLSALVEGMQELNTVLRSSDIKEGFAAIGHGIGTSVVALTKLLQLMFEWRDVILVVAAAWAGFKIGSVVLGAITAAGIRWNLVQTAMAGQAVSVSAAWAQATAAATLFGRALGVVGIAGRGALAALGPIGLLIGGAWMAWELFSSNTADANKMTEASLSSLAQAFRDVEQASQDSVKTSAESIKEAQRVAVANQEQAVAKLQQSLTAASEEFEKATRNVPQLQKGIEALAKYEEILSESIENAAAMGDGSALAGLGLGESIANYFGGGIKGAAQDVHLFGRQLSETEQQSLVPFIAQLHEFSAALRANDRITAIEKLNSVLIAMSKQKGMAPETIKSFEDFYAILSKYHTVEAALAKAQETLGDMTKAANRTDAEQKALDEAARLEKAGTLYEKLAEQAEKVDPVKKKLLSVQKQEDEAYRQAAAILQVLGVEMEAFKGQVLSLAQLRDVVAGANLPDALRTMAQDSLKALEQVQADAAKRRADIMKPKGGGANRAADFMESMRQKTEELTSATQAYRMEISGALSEEISLQKLAFEQEKELFQLRRQAAKAGIKDSDAQFVKLVAQTEELYALKRGVAEYAASWAQVLQPIKQAQAMAEAMGVAQDIALARLKEQEAQKVANDPYLSREEKARRVAVIEAELATIQRDALRTSYDINASLAERTGSFIEANRQKSLSLQLDIDLNRQALALAKTDAERAKYAAIIAQLKQEQREADAYAKQDWMELFNLGMEEMSAKAQKNFLDLWKNDIPQALGSVSDAFANLTIDMFTAKASWKDFGAALSNIFDSLARKIMEATFQMILFGQASQQGTAGGGGILGWVFKGIGMIAGGLMGGGAGAATSLAANPGYGGHGYDPALGEMVSRVPLHHTGGVIGSPAGASKVAPLSLWAAAERYHTGGIVGSGPYLGPNEIPIIAERGEGVVNKNAMAAINRAAEQGSNSTVNNVTFNNNATVNVEGGAGGSNASSTEENMRPVVNAMKQEMMNIADQRIMYQLRSQGLLNRGM